MRGFQRIGEQAVAPEASLSAKLDDHGKVTSVRGGHEADPNQLSLPLSVPDPRFAEVRAVAVPSPTTRRKQLGAFYTPQAMADKLVDWAVRSPVDRVLDPSFGGLVFLSAARDRLRLLGAPASAIPAQLYGADVDEDAHLAAAARTELGLLRTNLLDEDFFDVGPGQIPLFEAVVGNPPYVRYQGFNRVARRAHELAAMAGVPLTRLASSWAPFLVHAASFVAPEGRMAQVLPAEIIHAQYASGVLDFLSRSFRRITIVLFEERVFPGALEEVVLLLAEDRADNQGADVGLISRANVADLTPAAIAAAVPSGVSRGDHRRSKLVQQLLPSASREIYETLAADDRIVPFGELGSVDIGVVTGANAFFMRSREEARSLPSELLKPGVSKAAHVPGAVLSDEDHAAILRDGKKGLMFAATGDSPRAALMDAKTFLESGERAGLHRRYKCRVRNPWWALPLPRYGAPDLLLTYCSNEHPRLAVNQGRVLHTNTLHGVRIKDSSLTTALAASFYNSLTMLSAELVGRSYGGGVLKLEPSEAEGLLLPPVPSRLEPLLPQVDRLVRAKDLEGALNLVDPIVLGDGLGLSGQEISSLRIGADRLRMRRRSREKAAD